MKFTKMHGLGNDYVYVNGFDESVHDPAATARLVSDRHFGIGADGLILILPSEQAHVRMRMFNADGSEAQMCGNGIRCVAKYAFDRGLVSADEITVETLAGIKTLKLTLDRGKVSKVRVNMGQPSLLRGDIPMTGDPSSKCVDEPLRAKGQDLLVTCLSVGNPHCVTFVHDVAAAPLHELGPAIENHPAFPERINVHFVQVLGRSEVKMATWERGSGVTLACGTGATATCVACALNGRTDRQILAHLPGGDLELDWADDNHVYMTGPAVEVFDGEWDGA